MDLSDSNFCAMKLELGENYYLKIDQQIFSYSKELKTGSGTNIFEYKVKCLEHFYPDKHWSLRLFIHWVSHFISLGCKRVLSLEYLLGGQ